MGVVYNWSGEEIGEYRLNRLLGSGRAGDVYQGEHLYLGMPAAIKVFRAPAPGGSRTVFSAGVRAVAQMIHPNIVRVLGGSIARGHAYLVMDYAPNGNLRDRCPAGLRLTPKQILPYLQKCASALDFIHNHTRVYKHLPLVHCDVKPENILFGPGDALWLSDFDLAVNVKRLEKIVSQDTDGDVTYMAPEHLQAQPQPACDQYALATVVYELLSGHPPFQGTALEVIGQKMSKPAPRLVYGAPSAVETVVIKALERDPRDRYPTVRAFAEAFERAAG
jgi:serine/threonine protein kinase